MNDLVHVFPLSRSAGERIARLKESRLAKLIVANPTALVQCNFACSALFLQFANGIRWNNSKNAFFMPHDSIELTVIVSWTTHGITYDSCEIHLEYLAAGFSCPGARYVALWFICEMGSRYTYQSPPIFCNGKFTDNMSYNKFLII